MKNNFIVLAVGTAIYFLLLYFAVELVAVFDENKGISGILIAFGVIAIVVGFLAPRVFQPKFSRSAFLAALIPVIILGIGAIAESVKVGHFYMGEKTSLFIGLYIVQAILLLFSVGGFLAMHSIKSGHPNNDL
jgi:hypothetical protein